MKGLSILIIKLMHVVCLTFGNFINTCLQVEDESFSWPFHGGQLLVAGSGL